MDEDANRELRAMLLSLLHLPPMPAIVAVLDREDSTVLSTEHSESSHSILASLIEWTAVLDNTRLNNERMMAQTALQAQFHAELAKLAPDCSDEAVYGFYCHHTRLWANAYTPIANRMLFKPLDSISVGDKVHTSMLSYAKAQYHHLTDGREELKIADSLPYITILRKCAEWSREWERRAQESNDSEAKE